MRREDFRYPLPPGLIAQHPPATRGLSRLLCLDRRNGSLTDRNFQDFPHLLHPHDLLVFNDTRVLPARLFGRKDTGGKVEILVERLVDEHRFTAQVRSSKPPRADSRIILGQGIELSVLARNGDKPYDVPVDAVFSSRDTLFTSGTLGRFCTMMSSVPEAQTPQAEATEAKGK